jgi:hypothetical protein
MQEVACSDDAPIGQVGEGRIGGSSGPSSEQTRRRLWRIGVVGERGAGCAEVRLELRTAGIVEVRSAEIQGAKPADLASWMVSQKR